MTEKKETATTLWKSAVTVDSEDIFACGNADKKLGLTWRERRDMGLTRFGIYRAVRQLQRTKEWDKDAPLNVMSMDVAVLLAGHPDYVGAWDAMEPKLDWDSVLEFIKKMLPIILKLLLIFMII